MCVLSVCGGSLCKATGLGRTCPVEAAIPIQSKYTSADKLKAGVASQVAENECETNGPGPRPRVYDGWSIQICTVRIYIVIGMGLLYFSELCR